MNRQYIAIIQAGGKGTRMKELTHDEIPKPLILLNGKPLIEWQIMQLKKYGIIEFVFIVGHLGDMIKRYFKDGKSWCVKINYIEETEPLGSAGALYYAKEYVKDRDVILIFGDGTVTLLVHPNSHPYDSDLLIANIDGQVTEIDLKKNKRNYFYKNCVNAGLSIFKYELLSEITVARKLDYESELVKPLMKERQVYAYSTPEYVKDVGTPDRFRTAKDEQNRGVWKAKCLKNKQRAVFLDRDGTINVLKGFLKKADAFELIEGVAEAIARLNSSPYLTIVVTNQPVLARGECTFEEMDNIHRKMETELGRKGAYVNDIFFCPHHPHGGYEGEVAELKKDCDCRKPKIGMLIKAAEKYNIDLSRSWYIGDTTMDIQTGINAGMRTVLLKTGEAGQDGKYDAVPTVVMSTLKDAVEYLLKD